MEIDLTVLVNALEEAYRAGLKTTFETLRATLNLSDSAARPQSSQTAPALVVTPKTWKQAVFDSVAAMPETFRFSDVYHDDIFAKSFPDNRSITQSVAGVLRELVSQGFIQQLGRGEYRRLDDPNIRSADTVVVPARAEGFRRAAQGMHKWWAIRLHENMIPKIKYIAFYQVAPISAITHIAAVGDIEHDTGEPEKYQLAFAGTLDEINHVKLVPGGAVPALRNIRYSSRERLLRAHTLDELWPSRRTEAA